MLLSLIMAFFGVAEVVGDVPGTAPTIAIGIGGSGLTMLVVYIRQIGARLLRMVTSGEKIADAVNPFIKRGTEHMDQVEQLIKLIHDDRHRNDREVELRTANVREVETIKAELMRVVDGLRAQIEQTQSMFANVIQLRTKDKNNGTGP